MARSTVFESPPTRDETPHKKRSFQFGLRALLILTAFCAVIAALAGSMGGPVGARVVVAVYFMGLAAYAVLRGPGLSQKMAAYSRQLKQIRRKRKELADLAAEMKARLDEHEDSDGTG